MPSGTTDAQISLIESIPFPAKFKDLSVHFKTVQFPDLFRTTKLPNDGQQASLLTSPWRASYASTAGQPPAPTLTSPTTARPPLPNPQHSRSSSSDDSPTCAPRMSFNRSGQRIDERLPPYNPDVKDRLQPLRLCNRHFLTRCTFPKCGNEHDYPPLNAEEKAALRGLARSSACPREANCDDRYCVAAHQCKFGDRCWNVGRGCYYPHVADRAIVEVR